MEHRWVGPVVGLGEPDLLGCYFAPDPYGDPYSFANGLTMNRGICLVDFLTPLGGWGACRRTILNLPMYLMQKQDIGDARQENDPVQTQPEGQWK